MKGLRGYAVARLRSNKSGPATAQLRNRATENV